MRRRTFLKASGAGVASVLANPMAAVGEESRPNIVWIVVEDMSSHFGYQGERAVSTPNVDRLAREGTAFTSAYVTCPVCSPSRSALITGMYQTTIGAHHHRSFRGAIAHDLPGPVKTLPEYFRAAGYQVFNGDDPSLKAPGKTDYNFREQEGLYDGADFTEGEPGRPFFQQFQLKGGKNRRGLAGPPIQDDEVRLPPYYPDDPVLRDDWMRYLNAVQRVDLEVAEIMTRLKEAGRADNTIVFFLTDHGISHARGKQFLYQEGAHVPFIFWGPGRIPAGGVRDELVAHIDAAATSLALAGIEVPEHMEGRPLFGPGARERDYVVSARDRCDETVERMRSVRTERYTYIRNFYPERPHLQPNAYKDKKPIIERLRELHAEGALKGHPAERMFAVPRPAEELYDRSADPWELTNLAESPEHAAALAALRGILDEWIDETGDKGRQPEPEAVYDADMAEYLASRAGDAEATALFQANIAQMKAWAAEGK